MSRKPMAPFRNSFDGHLVGAVHDRAKIAASFSRIIRRSEQRPARKAGSLKVQLCAAQQIQRLRVFHLQPVRIAQRILDRQPHVRGAHLRDDGMILILHHRMNDALPVDDHIDLLIRKIEEMMRLDDFKTFVHHGRAVDGDAPAHVPVRMVKRFLHADIVQLITAARAEAPRSP